MRYLNPRTNRSHSSFLPGALWATSMLKRITSGKSKECTLPTDTVTLRTDTTELSQLTILHSSQPLPLASLDSLQLLRFNFDSVCACVCVRVCKAERGDNDK